MARFGKYAADGAVETEATECLLTGRVVVPDNSVREGVPGTRYFYRVIGGQYDRVTDELREQWRAEASGGTTPQFRSPLESVSVIDFSGQPTEQPAPTSSEQRRRQRSQEE